MYIYIYIYKQSGDSGIANDKPSPVGIHLPLFEII